MIAVELLQESDIPCPANDDQGFGCLSTSRGALPLRAMDVQARITGTLVHTVVKQTFTNVHPDNLEATYIFPLPDRAAVTGFRMEVAGRIIEGILKERGEARREYDTAIRAGHRAAITEEERPGVFTMRVGNLPPRESATVRLTLSGPVSLDGNEATWRFPLVVAPRYIPGTALPGDNVGDGTAQDTKVVPDASRISPPVLLPGFTQPVRFNLSVELDTLGLPLHHIRSSLHAVLAQERDGRLVLQTQPGERLNRDFLLRFLVGEDRVAQALRIARDATGDGATFLLTLHPPANAPRKQKPRDIVFLLDRSGSMEGWKMVAARRSVIRMLDTLRPQDRFATWTFDDEIEGPPGLGTALHQATDHHRFRAAAFLATVNSNGGTEMQKPLSLAANTLSGGYDDRDRLLVLITDGQVGNESELLKTLGQQLRNTRVFALGIDQAVNAGFLTRLATSTGGACELVENAERLDDVMDRIHRKLDTPLWSELSLTYEGMEVIPDSIMPARLPDVFPSSPVTIMGRCRPGLAPSITVQGRLGDGRTTQETVHGSATESASVGAVWARGHLRDLEDLFDGGRGDRRVLERRMVETSLRHGVLCRFTAFVAVDRAERVVPTGGLHRTTQPVEQPAGWAEGGVLQDVLKKAEMAPQEESDAFASIGEPEPVLERPAARMRAASKTVAAPSAAMRGGGGVASPKRRSSVLGAVISAGEAVGNMFNRPKAVTLEALRLRARELLTWLRRHRDAAARTRARSELMTEVGTLLAEARHAPVPQETLWALEELQAVLIAPTPDAEKIWLEAERLLTAFESAAPRPQPSNPRGDFWR